MSLSRVYTDYRMLELELCSLLELSSHLSFADKTWNSELGRDLLRPPCELVARSPYPYPESFPVTEHSGLPVPLCPSFHGHQLHCRPV